jgi:hypothetical protein
MTEEFERALVEMGILEPEPLAEDVANDRVLDALLGPSLVEAPDAPMEEAAPLAPLAPEREMTEPDAQPEPRQEAAPADPQQEAVTADPPTQGFEDVVSLLAAGRDICEAPNYASRASLRYRFAERMQQKLFAPSAPAAIEKRRYTKKRAMAQ